MRIGVAGIAGRMGRLVAGEAVAAGAVLAGGTWRAGEVPPAGATQFPDIGAFAGQSDVVVDFTHASAVQAHASALAAAGCAWVLGTTGLTAHDQEAVRQAATRIPIVQAANFSPGMALVLALAARLGAALPAETYDAEILDMHHRQKADAPSGTALALGRAVARGRGVPLESVAVRARDGDTGPRPPGAIGFAVLRGGQVVGEHTLLFAAGDEHIALTHRAFDRTVFARGAVRAAFWVHDRPPGMYGMDDVLGMGGTKE
jgi:4-hydroxy-tetrahydrodipicolinate reductase